MWETDSCCLLLSTQHFDGSKETRAFWWAVLNVKRHVRNGAFAHLGQKIALCGASVVRLGF
jgi:hypothetical protein